MSGDSPTHPGSSFLVFANLGLARSDLDLGWFKGLVISNLQMMEVGSSSAHLKWAQSFGKGNRPRDYCGTNLDLTRRLAASSPLREGHGPFGSLRVIGSELMSWGEAMKKKDADGTMTSASMSDIMDGIPMIAPII